MLDGLSTKARIGVLTPHLVPVPETELKVIAPAAVTIHAARVPPGVVDTKGNMVPSNIPDDVEWGVIGGGGFRTIGVINKLESVLGKPVITANQAGLWHALYTSGFKFEIPLWHTF